jgi:hypothetical protein
LHELEQLALAVPPVGEVHFLSGIFIHARWARGVDPEILLGLLADNRFQGAFLGQARSIDRRQKAPPSQMCMKAKFRAQLPQIAKRGSPPFAGADL